VRLIELSQMWWRSQPVGASLQVVDDVMCGGGAGCGSVGFSVEQQNLLWVMWRRGDSIREMERTLGETLPRIRRFLRQSGGIPPVRRQRRASHVTLVEREEMSRGIAAGLAARSIAGRIDRSSTV
jgi:hypothetical protein